LDSFCTIFFTKLIHPIPLADNDAKKILIFGGKNVAFGGKPVLNECDAIIQLSIQACRINSAPRLLFFDRHQKTQKMAQKFRKQI
jgi:hypothetical protein